VPITPITEWPAIPGFACRSCGDAARRNPYDLGEWGCARCNGASHSAAINFEVTDPGLAGVSLTEWEKALLDTLAARLIGP